MSNPMSDDEEEIDENRARIVYTSSMYQYAPSDVNANIDYNVGYAWAGLYEKSIYAPQPPRMTSQVDPQDHVKILLLKQADEQQRHRLQEIHRAKANPFSHDNYSGGAMEMDYIQMGCNASIDGNQMMHPVLVGHRRSRENWER